MGRAVGIDLGTANSCVAALIDGKPEIIPDSNGRTTVPSVYAIDATETPLIGYDAVAQSHLNRTNTIFAIKRFIGLKFKNEEVEAAARRLPYKVVEAANGDAWVEVKGKPKSPEEISSKILLYLKQMAEEYLKEPVDKAVITVPAHFNDAQRQATRDAGRIAGLEVLGIVNEPTAAALAYGINTDNVTESTSDQKRVIAVYDLGGGTFDISILSLQNGRFDVLSTDGDTYLGGEDIDAALLEYVLNKAKEVLKVDLSSDKKALQRVRTAARDAKHSLSHELSAPIELPYIAAGMKSLSLELTREQLEEITEPILSRTEKPCVTAMADAEVVAKQITDVILVGGVTKMPVVRKYCKKLFACEPKTNVDPDLAVALGAAALTGLIEGAISGIALKDVIPLTLGLEVQGGMVYPLIMRNTPVPTKVTKIFTTSAPNQNRVSIHTVQGESKFAPNNKSLSRFELTGIAPAPRGYPEIAVTFGVDSGGIVSISARDLDTNKEKIIEIKPTSGLADDEIQELIQQRLLLEQQQLRKKGVRRTQEKSVDAAPNSEKLDALRSLVFMTQFKLDSQGADYSEAKKEELIETLSTARQLLANPVSEQETEKVSADLQQQATELDDYLSAHWKN